MAKHFFTMNEHKIKQLVNYLPATRPIQSAYIYAHGDAENHFFNRGGCENDRSKAYRGFRQNVDAVIGRLSQTDRDLLYRHWKSSIEALAFQTCFKISAPVFVVVPGLINHRVKLAANGVSSRDGLFFAFEEIVVFNGPGEAIQPLIAHEIAHSLIGAKFVKERIPLPPVGEPDADLVNFLTGNRYPPDMWHEEILVDQMVSEWGYDNDLLVLWECAHRTSQKNPRKYYQEKKSSLLRLKSSPWLRA